MTFLQFVRHSANCWLNSQQRQARDRAPAVAQGYNAAIIAYGQTGTGKTFTMEGGATGDTRGIIPRAIEDIFTTIGSDAVPHSKFLVRASYLQIYNEVGGGYPATVCTLSRPYAEVPNY